MIEERIFLLPSVAPLNLHQEAGKVEFAEIGVIDLFEQVGTADNLIKGAKAEFRQDFPNIFSDIGQVTDYFFHCADIVVTQVLILSRNANGAAVEVADAQEFTAEDD